MLRKAETITRHPAFPGLITIVSGVVGMVSIAMCVLLSS